MDPKVLLFWAWPVFGILGLMVFVLANYAVATAVFQTLWLQAAVGVVFAFIWINFYYAVLKAIKRKLRQLRS